MSLSKLSRSRATYLQLVKCFQYWCFDKDESCSNAFDESVAIKFESIELCEKLVRQRTFTMDANMESILVEEKSSTTDIEIYELDPFAPMTSQQPALLHLFQKMCTKEDQSRLVQSLLDSLRYLSSSACVRQCLLCFYFNISSFAANLCTHTYGLHVIKKFLSLCYKYDADRVLNLFMHDVFLPNLDDLIKSPYPCRIIQDIFASRHKTLKKTVLLSVVSGLCTFYEKGTLFEVLTDTNGNYVVQQVLEQYSKWIGKDARFRADSLNFLINYISSREVLYELTIDRHACWVVQKLIKNEAFDTKLLIKGLYSLLPFLCNDEIGNRVVQQCIKHTNDIDLKFAFSQWILFAVTDQDWFANETQFTMQTVRRNRFFQRMEYLAQSYPDQINNFSKLSFGYYSSHVCDVAFREAPIMLQMRLIEYLTNPKIDINDNILFGLVNHEVGNHVVRNMLDCLLGKEGQQRCPQTIKMANLFLKYLAKVKQFDETRNNGGRRFSHAKKLFLRVEREMNV